MLIIILIILYHVSALNMTTRYIENEERRSLTMELNRFARIGKGVLTKAIGLQKNYVEVYSKGSDLLNESKSNCFTCSNYQKKEELKLLGMDKEAEQIHCSCHECPHSVWEPSYIIQKRYINEKNRYGYQPTLKSNAIKLFLLYHFLQPDGHGFIKDICIKDLAGTIGCTAATINACNDALRDYGYCYFSHSGIHDRYINILLPEYKNYHKTAAEGGRGYITMSDSMLFDLCGIGNLNTLRLNIKGILEVDNASYSDVQSNMVSSVVSQYQRLRGFLPSYCKRNVIQKALEQSDTIFDLSFDERNVTFSIKEKYAQKNMRKNMMENIKESLIDHVEHINTILEDAPGTEQPEEKERFDTILSMIGITPSSKYPCLCLTHSDYEDLSSLALQYNLHMVHMALNQIYNKYILKDRPIEKIGALARTIIRRKSFILEAS